jgi:hypothetical protein
MFKNETQKFKAALCEYLITHTFILLMSFFLQSIHSPQ